MLARWPPRAERAQAGHRGRRESRGQRRRGHGQLGQERRRGGMSAEQLPAQAVHQQQADSLGRWQAQRIGLARHRERREHRGRERVQARLRVPRQRGLDGLGGHVLLVLRRERLREREHLLDRFCSVCCLADPHGHVVRRHGTGITMIGLAVLIAAVGRLKLQVPKRVPADRQHDLRRHRDAALVVGGIGNHPGQRHGGNPRAADRLGGGLRLRPRLRHVLIGRIFVGVAVDQPGRRQGQHRHVPPDLHARIEVRVMMHEVGDDLLRADRR